MTLEPCRLASPRHATTACPAGYRPSRQDAVVARFAVAVIPFLLIPSLGAIQGGFHPDAWAWSGALAAWAAALGLVLGEGSDRLPEDWGWPLAGGVLLLWTLASWLWSAEPPQSLLEARRMVTYAAVVLALVVLARRHSARPLLSGTHAGIVALVLYALARYLRGARTFDEFEGYLLSEPLGYANAVGILSAMAVLLSIGAVADSESRRIRAIVGATAPLLCLALYLSGSRASWLALAIGLAATTALHRDAGSVARTVAALAPSTAIAVSIGRFSGLSTLSSPRLSGWVVEVAALACGVVAAGAAALTTRRAVSNARSRTLRLVVAIAVLGAFGVGLAAATGVKEPRSLYYRVAWREFVAHPLLGSGAGTFGHYWVRWGPVDEWGGALDAHSLYLETLAELGPIGLGLLGALLLYPLRRTLAHRSLPFVPAAAGATVAFLVHAGLDWDWEMPAVVVAGLACAAVVAFSEPEGAPEEASRTLPVAARAAALIAALAAGVAAIAGTRSTTEPSAAAITIEAPLSGASIEQRP
jgi:O-antigen ligase